MIKFLIILVLGFVAVRFIIRVLMRSFIFKVMSNSADTFARQYRQDHRYNAPNANGNQNPAGDAQKSASAPTPKKNIKPEKFSGGDYVQFEEIK